MSHFSLCVALPAEECPEKVTSVHEMESLLEPMMAGYEESPSIRTQLVFSDCTEEAQSKYESGKIDMVQLPDGTRCTFSDPAYYENYTLKDGVFYLRSTSGHSEQIETEETRKMKLLPDIPIRDIFSFEEYCRDYCGYRCRKGRWGYFYNPNAKWDWWCIGGRFCGPFLVKVDLEEYIPVDLENAEVIDGYRVVNGARKKDICWDEMKRRAIERQSLTYFEAKKVFKSKDTSHLGPFISVTESEVLDWNTSLYKEGETVEQLLKRKALGSDDIYPVSCFAFLDVDCQWHSSGDMGWFGVSSNDMPEEDWLHTLQSLIADLSDDDYLVFVDCHI